MTSRDELAEAVARAIWAWEYGDDVPFGAAGTIGVSAEDCRCHATIGVEEMLRRMRASIEALPTMGVGGLRHGIVTAHIMVDRDDVLAAIQAAAGGEAR